MVVGEFNFRRSLVQVRGSCRSKKSCYYFSALISSLSFSCAYNCGCIRVGMDIENEKSFALSEMEDEPPDDPERDKARLTELEQRRDDKTPGANKQPIQCEFVWDIF